MKYAGLLTLLAGFFLSLTSLTLFVAIVPRTFFLLCALAVQILGLSVAMRGHMSHTSGDR